MQFLRHLFRKSEKNAEAAAPPGQNNRRTEFVRKNYQRFKKVRQAV
jgi:hypothetical protein